MSLQCKGCHYVVKIEPGGRRPPWCPRCGADQKAETTLPVAATAGVASPVIASAVGERTVPAAAVTAPPPPQVRTLSPLVVEATIDDEITESPSEPEAVFTTTLVWQLAAWGCMIVCLGIVGVAVSQYLHPRGGKPVQMGVYGCMAMFGVGALISGYVGLRFAVQKYEVFADRLVAWQMFEPITYRWDQIRQVFKDVHPTWTTYRIMTSQGDFAINGEVGDHRRLGELIGEHVASRLLPKTLAEIEAGRDVRFGPMLVGAGGVTVDGNLQPWHRIGVLSFSLNLNPKRGTARVSKMMHLRLGTAMIEVGEIPNYRLFKMLAEHLFPACVATA